MKVNLSFDQLDILETSFRIRLRHFHISFRKCQAGVSCTIGKYISKFVFENKVLKYINIYMLEGLSAISTMSSASNEDVLSIISKFMSFYSTEILNIYIINMQKTNATLITYLDDLVKFNLDVLNLNSFQEKHIYITFSHFSTLKWCK